MIKLYRLTQRQIVCLFTVLTFCTNVFSQQTQAVEQGLIRIKVTEQLAGMLEKSTLKRTSDGVVRTGVDKLDEFNRLYNVTAFQRIFKEGGKFEAKHRKHGLHRWYVIRMDQPGSELKAISAYQSLINVEKVEPVYKKMIVGSVDGNFKKVIISDAANSVSNSSSLPDLPDDPLLEAQWHYNNTSQTGGTEHADIRLFEAWKNESGKSDVIVAVIDGGVETDHPDLAANMWLNQNEIPDNNLDDDNNGYVDDIHGYSFADGSGTISEHEHGTHVAGTIGAVTNNGIGVAGVAGGSGSGNGVRIMSCAVFSYENSPNGFAEALIYAADNGALIAQNSWGYLFAGYYEQVVLDAIDYFIAEAGRDENGLQTGLMDGGLVTFSAGNSGANAPYYPAFYNSTFSVAATTHEDIRAWYSNYGDWVDIAAPGGETDVDETQGIMSTLPGGQYGYLMGTSMACPHVSGVAALIISRFGKSGFSPHTLKERLRYATDPVDEKNPDYAGLLGAGRLNAQKALQNNDDEGPVAITDLAIDRNVIGKVTLTWTAPSDAGSFVSGYDIRYSTSPINETSFDDATSGGKPLATASAGSEESFEITGLPGGTLFYFAVKAIDFHENISLISNVISETTALAPIITVNPKTITSNLLTAQTETKTFTIRNEGAGPLEFQIANAHEENDFATWSPDQGNVQPGSQINITVTFNAQNRFTGTYTKDLRITSNDPLTPEITVGLVLEVSNNNAPIASVSTDSIHFKSVKITKSFKKEISIHNAGSNPLEVTSVSSTHPAFKTSFSSPFIISPFNDASLQIIFEPASVGIVNGELKIQTNDNTNSTFTIKVYGEGLSVDPIVIEPPSITHSLDKGTFSSGSFVIRNNSSYPAAFTFETQNERLTATAAKVISSDTNRVSRKGKVNSITGREKIAKIDPLLRAVGSERNVTRISEAKMGRLNTQALPSTYETGFEEFSQGPVNEQHGWFSLEGWSIESANPATGALHLRGAPQAVGVESFAISPRIIESYDDYPRYTYTTMKVNVDNIVWGEWEIVPQDPFSYVVTRIIFHEDRSWQVMSVDQDYNTVWTTMTHPLPSGGYFDIAVSMDSYGDETSGFPRFTVYMNGEKVFSGYCLGPAIGETAFLIHPYAGGGTLDIDDLKLAVGQHIPEFIRLTPLSGNVMPGEQLEVNVGFDATALDYGIYEADVIAKLEDADPITIPASMTVTGGGSLSVDPEMLGPMRAHTYEKVSQNIELINTGGQPIDFTFLSSLGGLIVSPSTGTISIRGRLSVYVELDGGKLDPGFYADTLVLTTSLGEDAVYKFPVDAIIWQENASFDAPVSIDLHVIQGQMAAKKFQIRNKGKNTILYKVITFEGSSISVHPKEGSVGLQPVDLTVSIDATNLEENSITEYFQFVTNDPDNEERGVQVNIEILPDTANGSGNIVREEWRNIPGKTVGSIPLNTPPDSVSEITWLAGEYGYGDNYGVRMRGYIQAPQTGYYNFFVASDDHSEIWLSPDMNEANKARIAWLQGFVNPGQWNVYQSQRSKDIYLEANQKYYIEVLHKESTGRDHLTVGWRLPNGRDEIPIPGVRLFTFDFSTPVNKKPVVWFITPDAQNYPAPSSVEIEADATDEDGAIVKVEFYEGEEKIGVDFTKPYSIVWEDVPAGIYQLNAIAFDNHGSSDTSSINIVFSNAGCDGAGSIQQEVWTGIPGKSIASIPLSSQPAFVNELSRFEIPHNAGDNYGTRVRGHLCVPTTGNYVFWIASDDASELWLSTDESPSNKIKIAYITGYTNRRQWDKYPSQKSAAIQLVAGEKYYIEALHKEATGGDHLTVGWQLPDGSLERPITGIHLIPFSQPMVSITSPTNGEQFNESGSITITAEAAKNYGTVERIEFFQNEVEIGEDKAAPYSFTWRNVLPGNYTLTAKAYDYAGNASTSAPVSIVVNHACSGTGTLSWDLWMGVPGTSVSDIPVEQNPIEYAISDFETPSYFWNNYGARVRGYICVPQTGHYTFWIASDDNGELWLSSSNDPFDKSLISRVPGHTYSRQWDKYTEQQSVPVYLEAGHQYYIEALHKEGKGNDHLAVGWQLPDGTLERPIPGIRLSPFINSSETAHARTPAGSSLLPGSEESPAGISLSPNPARHGLVTLRFDTGDEQVSNTGIKMTSSTGVTIAPKIHFGAQNNEIHLEIDERFSSGVYMINAIIGERRYTKRLVIH